MKTKLFSLLLAVAASVGTMFAESGTCGGNLTWDLTDGVLTISGSGAMNDYDYYFDSPWKNYRRSITSLIINNGVTSIGNEAFENCTGLTSIAIPNSVTSIGKEAFMNCTGLTSIAIPNSVTSIGHMAFYDCTGLTWVIIPNSVSSIGSWAFEGVAYICYQGTATGSPWGAMGFGYLDGWLVYSDETKTGLIGCNPAATDTIRIPLGVTSIGEGAFYNCSGLTSVTIPNSVTSIEDGAFNGCTGLTSVTLNSDAIASRTYTTYSSLKDIFGSQVTEYIIGDSVTSIGGWAFNNCSSLTSVTIPNSVTSIGNGAFSGCTALTSVTIPNSVTSIEDGAFSDCAGLTSVTIGNSVTSIGSSAFDGCTNLTSVTINSNSIVSQTYTSNSNLKNLFGSQVSTFVIGDSVTSIGKNAFFGCRSMNSITIPNSITNIGSYAFSGCRSMNSITIPNSITNIGSYAFDGCTGLTKVNITDISAWCAISFDNGSSNPLCRAHNLYLSDELITDLVIPNDVTSIGKYAFFWCTGLTSVTIPNSVTSIGEDAFYGCYDSTCAYATCGDLDRIRQLVNPTGIIHLRVEYRPLPYTITIAEALHGYVKKPQNVCDPEELTAKPDNGYHFVQWSDGNTDNPRPIELTQDTTFAAEFAINQYAINVSCDDKCGHIEGENGVYDYKTEHSYEAIANYGYHFDQWSDGSTDNPRTIVLWGETTLTAVFAKNKYAIGDNSNPEQGHIEGVGSFEYLDEISLTPVSEYGYHFDHWSDGNTDNPRTIILTQDTTFTAEFAIDKSGTCGENNALTWSYDDQSKTLTITGNGVLTENYTFGLEAPIQMNTLIIGDGVTSIGDSAFYETKTLNHLFIGANVASIGNYAFAECRNFDDITCYATIVPTINATTFANVGNKQYIYLYVPEDRERAYRRDEFWGEFDIRIKGTEETTTDTKSVSVEPADNTALFTWPTDSAAASYSLQIMKDGEVFCTLTFNANGQLTGIAFAPSRNGAAHAQAATMSVSAMSFTVTGLNSASKYAYRLSVTDESQNEIQAYSGEFATTGYEGEVNEGGEPEINTEGIEDVLFTEKATKILRNGQIFILRGDKVYNAQGALVK